VSADPKCVTNYLLDQYWFVAQIIFEECLLQVLQMDFICQWGMPVTMFPKLVINHVGLSRLRRQCQVVRLLCEEGSDKEPWTSEVAAPYVPCERTCVFTGIICMLHIYIFVHITHITYIYTYHTIYSIHDILYNIQYIIVYFVWYLFWYIYITVYFWYIYYFLFNIYIYICLVYVFRYLILYYIYIII
jgi:hypothetical protein